MSGDRSRVGASVLPWLLAIVLAGLSAFLLSRLLSQSSERRQASAAPVVMAIRRIAQLATVEVQISDVVRYEEVKRVLIFDFPKSATLRLRGRVLGGFDLARPEFRVTAEPARRVVRVTLPPARIVAVDPRLEWFDEKSGWINPITPQDRTRWFLWARGSLARSARQAGIETKAEEHARQLLGGAAQAFDWRAEIQIAKSGTPSD